MKTLPKDDISLSPVTDNEWLSRPRLFSLLGSFQEAHRMFHWAEGDGTDPGGWSLLDSSSLCCLCTIWLSLILCFPILKKSEPVPQNYYEIKWDDDGNILDQCWHTESFCWVTILVLSLLPRARDLIAKLEIRVRRRALSWAGANWEVCDRGQICR